MSYNISKLRQLIRTGEYLGENKDNWTYPAVVLGGRSPEPNTDVREKWIMDLKFFVISLEKQIQSIIADILHSLGEYHYKRDYSAMMGFLRSLYDNNTSENKPISADSQAVFIVHGHDDSLIDQVKHCVTQLDLKPIVLREQTDKGKTIIEKLEEWLGNCKCAIVLYTPCDVGRSVKDTDEEQRARQNVVYEHGLFQGYLGRRRVIALKKGNTIMPGDISGVVFTSIDQEGWQEKLKKEIVEIDQ